MVMSMDEGMCWVVQPTSIIVTVKLEVEEEDRNSELSWRRSPGLISHVSRRTLSAMIVMSVTVL